MESLIANIKNKKYSYVEITNLGKPEEWPAIRRINGFEDGVLKTSHPLGINAERRLPTENYEMIENGYIEKYSTDRHGIFDLKVVFHTALPKRLVATKE